MWKSLLFSLSLTTSAWGFSLTSDFINGFYWSELPITMTVVESDSTIKANLESITKRAINEWQNKTNLSIWKFQSSASSVVSSNIIRWSKNFAAETGMDANSVLAVAIRYTNGPYFAKTEIVINGNHTITRDLNHLYTTLVHELGHTMGLDHSDVYDAVMAPTLQNPYRGLQNDDANGMESAIATIENRQVTGYVSPLAYENDKSASAASVGCGTVQMGSGGSNIVSLSLGLLLGLFKKVLSWFKSRI